MATKIPYVITGKVGDPGARITLSLDGRFRQFALDSAVGRQLHEAIQANASEEDIRLLADIPAFTIARKFHLDGLVLDDRDQLRLNGKVVDYGLTDVIKRLAEANEDVEPLVNFLERVDKNPNKSVAQDLYRFLAKGGLPITPDGCFHAYKRVGPDFLSIHSGREPTWTQVDGGDAVEATGRTHYPVGSTVWMRREDCDEDRQRICSRGLHACSFDYLQEFNGQYVIDVIIDPADVTAIPNDYNDSKLRCCKLRVVAHIPDEDVRQWFSHVVDRRHPPVQPTASEAEGEGGDWRTRGLDDGAEAGASDHDNGYQYDPQPEYPCEIDEDCDPAAAEDMAATNAARVEYAQGFMEGYAAGWNSVDDVPESEDEKPVTVEEAKQWGAADGAVEAAHDFSEGYGYLNDHSDGDHYSEVAGYGDREVDDDAGEAYRIAFELAYVTKWQELNG